MYVCVHIGKYMPVHTYVCVTSVRPLYRHINETRVSLYFGASQESDMHAHRQSERMRDEHAHHNMTVFSPAS